MGDRQRQVSRQHRKIRRKKTKLRDGSETKSFNFRLKRSSN